jgi:hypothetical protein
MKCSSCYADNNAWATVCSACGQSVRRLELCPAGHLLPPGEQECPICPSLWPAVDAFAGPPLLRGLLWVERGRLMGDETATAPLAFVEVRDQESPLVLSPLSSGAMRLSDESDGDANCRILMRPDGLKVCKMGQSGDRAGLPTYTALSPGEKLDWGGMTLRYQEIRTPAWAEKLAAN